MIVPAPSVLSAQDDRWTCGQGIPGRWEAQHEDGLGRSLKSAGIYGDVPVTSRRGSEQTCEDRRAMMEGRPMGYLVPSSLQAPRSPCC